MLLLLDLCLRDCCQGVATARVICLATFLFITLLAGLSIFLLCLLLIRPLNSALKRTAVLSPQVREVICVKRYEDGDELVTVHVMDSFCDAKTKIFGKRSFKELYCLCNDVNCCV